MSRSGLCSRASCELLSCRRTGVWCSDPRPRLHEAALASCLLLIPRDGRSSPTLSGCPFRALGHSSWPDLSGSGLESERLRKPSSTTVVVTDSSVHGYLLLCRDRCVLGCSIRGRAPG